MSVMVGRKSGKKLYKHKIQYEIKYILPEVWKTHVKSQYNSN